MLSVNIYSQLVKHIPKGIVVFWARFYVLTSFITKTYGEAGVGFTGRFTFPDFIATIGLIILIGKKFTLPRITAAIIMIFAFLAGAFYSLSAYATLFEVLIHFFLLLSVVLMYNAYRNNICLLIQDVATVTIIASVIGLLDFFGGGFGLPRIFSGRADGEVVSGFRNAGQAGAYILVCLTILIPVVFSDISNLFTPRQKRLITIGIIVGGLFLLSTAKIAAYIGVVFGFLFFNIFRRRVLPLIFTLVFGVVGYFVYDNLESFSTALNNRVKEKVRTRVTENINGEKDPTKEGFLADNYGMAMSAFKINPYTGTGLGAFAGNYKRYEVHSTYFKMLGETGIIGIIGYCVFIYFFIGQLRSFKKYPTYGGKILNPFADYLKNMWPFILGCFISWTYTYHLRKREFWILCTIVILCNLYAKFYEYSKKDAGKYLLPESISN
ncbi:O-Antigen ligase [Chitinophaga sp. CF118]|uniref:O-antigen ligase family protein n=1 Tax=Chitinophaga sp. CF118 TaxID=1884367 RepID=UPI0008EA3257|nr:O-antigen ligase family protein [Chitinophaga sp. CF118]SFD80739.1 O-Antigen ligase [Chitinophaga sp. CF118]